MKLVVNTTLTMLLVLAAAAATAQGRGPGPGPQPGPAPSPGPEARECSIESILLDLPAQALSEREITDLVFAREEEKLARDVYLSLHETWGLKSFRKIARSERGHMKAVAVLLAKYGLDDPVGDNAVGVFSNPTLQTFYADLVAAGSASLVDALAVGVYVEEMDLADVDRMLRRSDNTDVDTLYQNLAKGARNHLRAYYRQLTRRGEEYDPIVFLSPETFEEIVESATEKGLVDENGEWLCGGWSRGTLD